MTESSTPEHQLPAPGFVPTPFWGDPIEPDRARPGSVDEAAVAASTFTVPRPAEPVLDLPPSAVTDGEREADREQDSDGEAESEDPAEEDDDEEKREEDDEDARARALRRRFHELVEERERRARYAHHLTRPVFTPAESAMGALVERRAAVWVPTMTFVATVVSAVAAVVLATRLRSDPTDPTGHQLLVVMVTVCLLAAAFATLLRAEVHYERLRPRGRVVRHDVADAYEMVRDAPRRLVHGDAPIEVLRRIAGLLPTAEQLVDALTAYSAEGGTRVRAHPAYERILRMRAEVEALEVMLEEHEKTALPDPVHGVDAPLPKPEQVPAYSGLVDLAESLLVES